MKTWTLLALLLLALMTAFVWGMLLLDSACPWRPPCQ
jgi:hypothetical protein